MKHIFVVNPYAGKAKAKEQLEYVIENGHKLSTSKEASKLLEEIS